MKSIIESIRKWNDLSDFWKRITIVEIACRIICLLIVLMLVPMYFKFGDVALLVFIVTAVILKLHRDDEKES